MPYPRIKTFCVEQRKFDKNTHTFLSAPLFTHFICEPINHTFFIHAIHIEQGVMTEQCRLVKAFSDKFNPSGVLKITRLFQDIFSEKDS